MSVICIALACVVLSIYTDFVCVVLFSVYILILFVLCCSQYIY